MLREVGSLELEGRLRLGCVLQTRVVKIEKKQVETYISVSNGLVVSSESTTFAADFNGGVLRFQRHTIRISMVDG